MRYLSLILFLLICTGLRAQTSLPSYREAVAAYSWDLKAARSRTEEAGQLLGRAWTGYLPRLSMDGSFSAAFRHFSGVKPWTFALQPQIVQTLYGGGSVRAGYRQAELEGDIAVYEEDFTRLDVRYAADYAYWNLSAMKEFRDAMRRYVEIIGSLKRVVDWRFSEGYIAKGDVLMIEARLSEAQFELVTAEQNYEVALHNFNILRGTEGTLAVELAQTIFDSIPMPARIPYGDVLARRPDYLAARLRTQSSEQAMRLVRAAFNPQVSLGVGGVWQPDDPNRTGATSVDGSAFVRLSVPIFHWGERRRAVGAARAVIAQREWAAAGLHDDIVREELNGWTAIVNSRAKTASLNESLRIARENLDISTYSYGEGLATILDVLQAQLSWIQLYTNAINAQYDYSVAVSAYERITAR